MKTVKSFLLISFFLLTNFSISHALDQVPSVADLLKLKIQELETQLASLQAQLTSQNEVITNTSNPFTKNLSLGMSDPEVEKLQTLLAELPEIYPEGLITGFFGNLTQSAVIKFQTSRGIEPLGIVGPKTRIELNNFYEQIFNQPKEGGLHRDRPSSASSTKIFITTSSISQAEAKIITLNTTSVLIADKVSSPLKQGEADIKTTEESSTLVIETNKIFIATSKNQGEINFNEPLVISNASSESKNPQTVSYKNLIAVVWQESLNDKTDIFFSKSIDGGKTFSKPLNLSNSLGLPKESTRIPSMAVGAGGVIAVAWEKTIYKSGDEIEDQEIYVTRSLNNGETFSPPKNISNSKLVARNPIIKINESNQIALTWIEHPLDYSVGWQEDGLYLFDALGGPGSPAGGPHLVITYSNDFGGTFEDPRRITEDIPVNSYNMTTDNFGTIHIAMQNDTLIPKSTKLTESIFYTKSLKPYEFATPKNIDPTNNNLSGNPEIIIDGFRNIYIFRENNGTPDKTFDALGSKSGNIGGTFEAPENISKTLNNHSVFHSYKQTAAIEHPIETLYLLWAELNNTEPTKTSLYISKSIDLGKTWGIPISLETKEIHHKDAILDITPNGTLILGITSKERPSLK